MQPATFNLVLTMAVQAVWGVLVKRWPALQSWPNRLIPIMNIVVGLLASIAISKAVPAANASVLGGLIGGDQAPAIAISFVGMLLTTGGHSVGKNTLQWLRQYFFAPPPR